MLDESHERTLATDVLFGVVRNAMEARKGPVVPRGQHLKDASGSSNGGAAGDGVHDAASSSSSPAPHQDGHGLQPLKVVVMSATLDIDMFAGFFRGYSTSSVSGGGGDSGTSAVSTGTAFSVTNLVIPGRQHPVDIFYSPQPVDSYTDAALQTVVQICVDKGSEAGDILVFLPGQEDIDDLAALLRAKAESMASASARARLKLDNRAHQKHQRASKQASGAGGSEGSGAAVGGGGHVDGDDEEDDERVASMLTFYVCPLYASLSQEMQLAAFEPAPPGTRKVILSTNIAETSVTVNGVRFVVDCGKVKVRSYGSGGSSASSSSTSSGGTSEWMNAGDTGVGGGVETLAAVGVSKAQAIQRAGRAGREAPGECYRLYTEETYESLPAQPVPDIMRVSLASVLLQLLAMGMNGREALTFPWVQPPPAAGLRRALILLRDLGAIASIEKVRAMMAAAASAATAAAASASDAEAAPASSAVASTPAPQLAPDGLFCLTTVGHRMAALPIDPLQASLLLCGAAEGAGSEAACLVALLSVEGVWVSPGREKQGQLDSARRKFTSLEGDHLTLLNVLRSYERVVRAAVQEGVKMVSGKLLADAGFGKGGQNGGSSGGMNGAAGRDDEDELVGQRKAEVAVKTITMPGAPLRTDDEADAETSTPRVPLAPTGPGSGRASSSSPSNPRSKSSAGSSAAAAAGGGIAGDDHDGSTSAGIDSLISAWTGTKGGGKRHVGGAGGGQRRGAAGSGAANAVAPAASPPAATSSSSARAIESAARTVADAAGRGIEDPSQRDKAGKRAVKLLMKHVTERASNWCWEHFVSLRALRKAVAIRDQIAEICASLGVQLGSCGSETDKVRRALLNGCYLNVARRLPGGEGGGRPEYRTMNGLTVAIHPSSTMVLAHATIRNQVAANAAKAARRGTGPSGAAAGASSSSSSSSALQSLSSYPETVVFAELVHTSSTYMRYVTRVETAWLSEIRADFFAKKHLAPSTALFG